MQTTRFIPQSWCLIPTSTAIFLHYLRHISHSPIYNLCERNVLHTSFVFLLGPPCVLGLPDGIFIKVSDLIISTTHSNSYGGTVTNQTLHHERILRKRGAHGRERSDINQTFPETQKIKQPFNLAALFLCCWENRSNCILSSLLHSRRKSLPHPNVICDLTLPYL